CDTLLRTRSDRRLPLSPPVHILDLPRLPRRRPLRHHPDLPLLPPPKASESQRGNLVTDPSPRTETAVEAAWTRVWKSLLIRGIVLVLVVAALGMGLGWLISGTTGLVGGAVGGGLAAVFIIITL